MNTICTCCEICAFIEAHSVESVVFLCEHHMRSVHCMKTLCAPLMTLTSQCLRESYSPPMSVVLCSSSNLKFTYLPYRPYNLFLCHRFQQLYLVTVSNYLLLQ